MAYNPGNQGMVGQFMVDRFKDQSEEKRQRKENDALVKGFMQMHQASPTLQQLIPVQDWGDVSANQIKGWVDGVAMQQQQQAQQQQAQQQQQAEAQRLMQQQALMRVLQGVGPQRATPASQYLQATGGQGMDGTAVLKLLQGFDPPQAPTSYDLDGDGKKDVYFGPTGNQVNLETADTGSRARKDLESLMTRQMGGSDWNGTPVRMNDYITKAYNPDGTVKDAAQVNVVGEEFLRQANELSLLTSGKPLFVPRPGVAPVAAAAAEVTEQADSGGALGKAVRALLKQKPQNANELLLEATGVIRRQQRPVVAAGPGQTTVAPVDPLVQQAMAFIQQQEGGGEQQFATMEEAEAARERGYRGPAVIGGRRAVIE